MKAVIVLPTYNEKGNIEKIINILEDDIFPKIKKYEMYILVADDNSPDHTADEVRHLMKKWKNIDISIGEKKGLGAAYIRGMSYAVEKMKADVIFEMDADLQHDPTKIPEFLDKIEKGYDMVIGTRYSHGGSIPENWPIQRKIFSVFGNLLVRSILMRFSIHDWTGGYRALKKEVFLKEKESLESYPTYTFQIAFLFKAVKDGYKIAEVPFHFTDRALGRSKFPAVEYIYSALKYVITERIKELERFIKFLIVGGTGFVVQVIIQETSLKVGAALLTASILGSFINLFVQQTDMNSLTQAMGAAFGAEAAILSNFFFNNIWTFSDTKKIKQRSNAFTRLIKFNITSLAAIFVQFAAVWISIKVLGNYIQLLSWNIPTRIFVLFPTIIFIVIPLNYIVYNKIIWKTQYLDNENLSNEKV